MASKTARCLLHLSRCLRHDSLSHIQLRTTVSRIYKTNLRINPKRSFSKGLTSNGKELRPPRNPHPQSKHDRPPAPPQPRSSKPPSRSSPILTQSKAQSQDPYIASLTRQAPEVLLYHAAPHVGFTWTSMVAGAIIIVGSVNFFSFALQGREDETGARAPIPWHIKALTLVPSVAMAVMGTTFLVAPTRLVRAVALVSSRTERSSGGPILRFYMRPGFPFFARKGKVIEAEPANVQLDLKVRSTDLRMTQISLGDSSNFTAQFLTRPTPPKKSRRVGEVLGDFLPALVHNVRRMFLRDSIAYLNIEGHGLWKLDLHQCYMLDQARPLKLLTRHDQTLDRSIFGRVRELISS